MKYAAEIIVISFLFAILGCGLGKKGNESQNKISKRENVNLDSIVLSPSKRKLLHEYLLKTYWIEENFIYNSNVIVCDSAYFNIGLYDFSQNSAKFSGIHYLFNYKDTVVFVEGNDTVKFSNEVEKFISTYDNKLTPKNKETLRNEKRNWW